MEQTFLVVELIVESLLRADFLDEHEAILDSTPLAITGSTNKPYRHGGLTAAGNIPGVYSWNRSRCGQPGTVGSYCQQSPGWVHALTQVT